MTLTEAQIRERIEMYGPLVQKYNSPISVATRLAQLILESQLFTSPLAKKSNNGFGIKMSAPWTGDSVPHVSGEVGGARESKFREYPTEEDSIKDNASFYTSTPFRQTDAVYGLAIKATNYKDEAKNLGPKFPGDPYSYAGDSEYANKIIRNVEKYDLTRFNIEKEITNMATHLIIAGHGTNPKNGYFDPGATGQISMGEHRYMRDILFPLMKKYVPEGIKAVFFSDYNVYSKGNLVALANSYGKDTVVSEMHFDATGNSTASGGHIIIHKDFKADSIDLALRDAVQDVMGLAYPIHRGDKGISGRGDLANPNRAAKGGVNYRLPELGFGTNPRDANIMLNQADKYAKALCKALFGEVKEDVKDTPVELDGVHVVVHGEYLWLIAEKYGITVQNLKNWNKLTSNIIYTGQVLKVEKPDTVIEEGEPDPEVSTPIEDQPVDEGEETKAIELDPWHFYDNETGKVYKISETEMVYE